MSIAGATVQQIFGLVPAGADTAHKARYVANRKEF